MLNGPIGFNYNRNGARWKLAFRSVGFSVWLMHKYTRRKWSKMLVLLSIHSKMTTPPGMFCVCVTRSETAIPAIAAVYYSRDKSHRKRGVGRIWVWPKRRIGDRLNALLWAWDTKSWLRKIHVFSKATSMFHTRSLLWNTFLFALEIKSPQ